MTIFEFITENLLAFYGAAVGTLALALNFMRYRHSALSSKIRLKLEIVVEKSQMDFETEMNPSPKKGFVGGQKSVITHKIRIRNLGNVTAHIQDVWVEAQNKKIAATTPEGDQRPNIYLPASEVGNLDIAPRSSRMFFVFSNKQDGYQNFEKAFALDETGKQWRS